jgi:hypothetical protein
MSRFRFRFSRNPRARARAERRKSPALWFDPLEGRLLLSTEVLTYHNDNSRDGLDSTETTLTPANVNPATFGKLFTMPVDGSASAQPLYAPAVTINGQVHNVVYAATENDSLYAFDADNNLGSNASSLWADTPGSSNSLVPANETPDTGRVNVGLNASGESVVGITSTPAIDANSNTLYTVTDTKQALDQTGWTFTTFGTYQNPVAGTTFSVDFGSAKQFDSVTFDSGQSDEYARQFEVQVSNDRLTWSTVYDSTWNSGEFDDSPLPAQQTSAFFPHQTASHVRIILTAANPSPWSVTTFSAFTHFQRLHAIDITTGAEKFGGPVTIRASVPGTGDESMNGTVAFDPDQEVQRAALLLSSGNVYIAWASYNDSDPWHGWVMAYNAATLQQTFALNDTPNGKEGGVWQAGAGLAADSSGNVYFATGNGDYSATTNNYGNSVLKLSSTGSFESYFTPSDYASLNLNDIDLGSGGVVLLPDQPGSHTHELVAAGKEGTIYILNRDNLGQETSNDSGAVQELTHAIGNNSVQGMPNDNEFGDPAYFNGNVYYGAGSDAIKQFQLSPTTGLLSTSPFESTSNTFGVSNTNYGSVFGTTPSVSSDGTTNGIVWAVEWNNYGQPAVLHAYDATNVSNELYNSAEAGGRDWFGVGSHFETPTVANGKVYVSSQTNGYTFDIAVFGLLTSHSVVLTDNLNDYSNVFYHSANWGFDTTIPASFNGDTSRLVRTTNTTETIQYLLWGLTTFDVRVYVNVMADFNYISLSISPNDVTWTAVPFQANWGTPSTSPASLAGV